MITNRFLKLLLCSFFSFIGFTASAQKTATPNPELLDKPWDAQWITYPDGDPNAYGVYYFRKHITLDGEPAKYEVNVSADNRYKLYVNGKYVANGPARGDEMHWRFETLDIAKLLHAGDNVIAAVVWNFGEERPLAQHTAGTAFILQGNSAQETAVNTNETWKVYADSSYAPLKHTLTHHEYYVVGPGEEFNGETHPWNWQAEKHADGSWPAAAAGTHGMSTKAQHQYGNIENRVLVPRNIPMMEETKQFFKSIRSSSMPLANTEGFLKNESRMEFPANHKVTFLLDQGVLTNAYPVLRFTGGKGTKITLTYAESLTDDENNKGNRDEITNKHIQGARDIIHVDGGESRIYQTLWWRTFRYVQVEIETGSTDIKIDQLYSIFTGYPFKDNAFFKSNEGIARNIWETGWRTQRLCAVETYFDCPYYEQLQYVGDTRIQGLISSYVDGDSALYKNALQSIYDSRMAMGLTQSRYPSYYTQIIPTFSLLWIAMLNDYRMLYDDADFVQQMEPAVMDVIGWFEARKDSTGLVKNPEYWNFIDWVRDDSWQSGIPPGVTGDYSSTINLQYAYALQQAADILKASGATQQAGQYLKQAEQVKDSVRVNFYDTAKGLYADTPAKLTYSEHPNILAILTGEKEADSLMIRVLADTTLSPSSYYFDFYKMEALLKSGHGDDYVKQLGPWKEMLDLGLTTFAEKSDPTRSDCHAWSASPLYHFLSIVAGIRPGEAGFKKVSIKPHLGDLQWIETTMPHRQGNISLKLNQGPNNTLTGFIMLPPGLDGDFEWKGHKMTLNAGLNSIKL